jgi:hypothetical protein
MDNAGGCMLLFCGAVLLGVIAFNLGSNLGTSCERASYKPIAYSTETSATVIRQQLRDLLPRGERDWEYEVKEAAK